jgi:hypothetical protein
MDPDYGLGDDGSEDFSAILKSKKKRETLEGGEVPHYLSVCALCLWSIFGMSSRRAECPVAISASRKRVRLPRLLRSARNDQLDRVPTPKEPGNHLETLPLLSGSTSPILPKLALETRRTGTYPLDPINWRQNIAKGDSSVGKDRGQTPQGSIRRPPRCRIALRG